jgi:hypothetical protein
MASICCCEQAAVAEGERGEAIWDQSRQMLTLKLLDSLPSKQTCFHEMRNLGLHVLVAIATTLNLPLSLSSFITNDCCRAGALARALKPG